MDLSWCIICDNRIDDILTESSLYCSETCKGKDQSNSICEQNNDQTTPLKPVVKAKINSICRNKKPTTPSSSYPWELLYTRPR
ncbi:uncharacterized protein BX664DRAFT_343435, partial [Halteromyces radiatus]|uniref:uncharacterized protein n=1 Tax=Halteromyces radiatus TaxID=101107 RepID=UPI00221F6C46